MNSKRHSSRAIACLILIGGLLLALAWPAPADPTAAESRLALPDDFSGYRHIHSLVINDPESPLYGFHHFYVNEIGWKTFASQGPFPYPRGTVFVGAVYEVDQDGMQYNEGSGAVYTVMQKEPKATQTGGWLFGTFDAKGALVSQDVKTECHACHQPLKDRDFVFSRPLDLALPGPAQDE